MKGKFYGVGVGPGDPELLTIKGKRIIEECDIIVTPITKGDSDSTALNIVSPYIGDKDILNLLLPMTKDTAELEKAWNNGAQKIMELLDADKNVAFITLGDPSLFSTFMYVYRPVREAGYQWEIVPGINAPSATAARLGIGLADGKESLAIMAATTDLEAVEETIKNHDNTVLMKGAGKWPNIAAILEKLEVVDKTAAVERCTMKEERVFADVKNMPEDLSYFLTAIIRKGL
ncbi:MAG: precorrin-2 C(20)-methyltransferase [Bacillota bacterium]|nr:precorrin-2 C(20)-methyltransferase [Bacillota bacterium]